MMIIGDDNWKLKVVSAFFLQKTIVIISLMFLYPKTSLTKFDYHII